MVLQAKSLILMKENKYSDT